MSATQSPTRSVTGPASRSASRAILRTEARLFAREPSAFVWILGFPTVLLCVLSLVPPFRESNPDLNGGQRVVDVYVQVAALLAMITGSVQLPAILTGYRERGIIRRLRTTPVRPHSLLFAQVVMHAVGILGSVALVLVVGRVAIGTPLPQNPVAYALSVTLVLASALALGSVITALSPSSRTANVLGMVVMFPQMFTAGLWLPVQTMPDLMRSIVHATPMGAATEAINAATLGDWPDVVDLLVITGWAGLFAVVAVRWFRWE